MDGFFIYCSNLGCPVLNMAKALLYVQVITLNYKLRPQTVSSALGCECCQRKGSFQAHCEH